MTANTVVNQSIFHFFKESVDITYNDIYNAGIQGSDQQGECENVTKIIIAQEECMSSIKCTASTNIVTPW